MGGTGRNEWRSDRQWGMGALWWCNAKHMLNTCGAEAQSICYTPAQDTQLCNSRSTAAMKDVLVGGHLPPQLNREQQITRPEDWKNEKGDMKTKIQYMKPFGVL